MSPVGWEYSAPGVTGLASSEDLAKELAAGDLKPGETAMVACVRVGLNEDLQRVYTPAGPAWTGRLGAGGAVIWTLQTMTLAS